MDQVSKHIKNRNFKEALKILENKLHNNPDDSTALGEAGMCYMQTGNLSLAEEKFKLASKLSPGETWIWQNYAYTLFNLGKITTAINALKKASDFNPEDILILHQIAFLYNQKKDYQNALVYIDKALELSNGDSIFTLELLGLKASIYENIDGNKAFSIYSNLLNYYEDPQYYDKISNLVINKFEFSNQRDIYDLSFKQPDYNQATHYLRDGELDKAVKYYKKAISKDKHCYPAYLGIAQALYEMKFGSRQIENFSQVSGISELFKNYNQLEKQEKNIINASVAPLGNFVQKLNRNESHFVISPIDVKLTDFPANQYLKNKSYLKSTPYCTLRGIGGDNGYVGIERLRDLLWKVPEGTKFAPACVAHEFAHQVWCLLDSNKISDVQDYYENSKKSGNFVSNYSSWSVEEYFAEYYAYYARFVAENLPIPQNDSMVDLLLDLQKI